MKLVYLVFIVLAGLVAVNWLFYLVLHLIYKKLRLPPGNLIAWQIVGLLLFYIGVLYENLTLEIVGTLTDTECRSIGVILIFSGHLQNCYAFSLCYEIYVITKNPLNNKYNKRANIYHIVSQSFSWLLGILWASIFGSETMSNEKAWEERFGSFYAIDFLINEILAISAFILIIMAIRIMNNTSRYLYRYIAFCVVESLNTTLFLCYKYMSIRLQTLWLLIITLIYGFMTAWRILEVTVLNNYFDSMKNNVEIENRKQSYIPPNQSLFQANMIAAVQAILISLSLVFDSLEQNKQGNAEADFYLTEHSEDPNLVEYKKWKLEKVNNSQHATVDQLKGSLIEITEYAPTIFSKIRNQNQISDSYLRDLFKEQQIEQIRKNVGNPGGASGWFFYFTSDKRFIMKTITKEEQKVIFDGFLDDYFLKISHSLLARYYGIYRIGVGTQEPFSILMMGNLALPELQVIAQFDLKGSKVKRKVHELSDGSIENVNPGTVYKDEDFENFIGGIFPNQPNIIIEKIISDSNFLEQHNIMDYSILLKICKPSSVSSPFLFHGKDHTYCIGIIDFLQKFTWGKQAELKFKSILNDKEQISSQNPTKYAKRFRKKMIEYISVSVVN